MGTNEAERGLNTPKSEEELAEQILAAVSENDGEEMERLFSVDISPDAEPEESEDSEEDSPEEDGKNDSDEGPDDQTAADDSEEEEDASTATHEPDPAAERIAQLESKLHNAEAAVGRMASMQSRLAQLERQLKQQAENSVKQKEKEAADSAEGKLRERIAKLKEIDPDTAEILETMLEQRPKDKAPQEQTQEADHEGTSEEYYKLLNYHPDAETIFKHPSWHAWKNTLTAEQRAWASSNRADQVAAALNAYKQYMQGFGKQPPVEREQVAPADDVVDATKQARERKLQRSADSSDKPVKKQPKFDESRFFEEAYEKIAKEAGIVY